VQSGRRFGGTYCLNYGSREAIVSAKTLVQKVSLVIKELNKVSYLGA